MAHIRAMFVANGRFCHHCGGPVATDPPGTRLPSNPSTTFHPTDPPAILGLNVTVFTFFERQTWPTPSSPLLFFFAEHSILTPPTHTHPPTPLSAIEIFTYDPPTPTPFAAVPLPGQAAEGRTPPQPLPTPPATDSDRAAVAAPAVAVGHLPVGGGGAQLKPLPRSGAAVTRGESAAEQAGQAGGGVEGVRGLGGRQ